MTGQDIADLAFWTAVLGAVAACTGVVVWAVPGGEVAGYVVYLLACILVGISLCCWIVTRRRDHHRHRRR